MQGLFCFLFPPCNLQYDPCSARKSRRNKDHNQQTELCVSHKVRQCAQYYFPWRPRYQKKSLNSAYVSQQAQNNVVMGEFKHIKIVKVLRCKNSKKKIKHE